MMEAVGNTQDPKIVEDFAGRKYELANLVGKRIAITKYKQEPSQKHPGTTYFKIQFICLDGNGNRHLGFMTTGAQQIVQVLGNNPPVPLYKTIEQVGRSFYFGENRSTEEEAIETLSTDLNIDFSKLS